MLRPSASRTVLRVSAFNAHCTQVLPFQWKSLCAFGLPPKAQWATEPELARLRRSTPRVLPDASGVFCAAVAVKTRWSQLDGSNQLSWFMVAAATAVTGASGVCAWLAMPTSVPTDVVVMAELVTALLTTGARAAVSCAGSLLAMAACTA